MLSIEQLSRSLLVCDNEIIKKELIDQMIDIVTKDLYNKNKDILIEYQQYLYYIQSKYNINLNNLIEQLSEQIGFNIDTLQINNYHQIITLLEKLPYWIDKKYFKDLLYNLLSKDFDIRDKYLF